MVRVTALSPTELARAADANLAAHAGWVHQRTPGMQVVAAPDVVLVDSGLPCDTFNLVCGARLAPETAPARIREILGHFAASGRPFSWWLGPFDHPPDLGALLCDAGLHAADGELAMAADLAALRPAELSPGGLQIRRVRSAEQLRDFARIVAAGWTPPDREVLRFYELGAPALLSEDAALWLYVGYLGETPVATAELALGGGVAGLYNIITLEPYRRRGIGTALTLRPLLDARAHGYHTAILQAAPAGVGVYTRLGFEPFGQITEYKPA
jgi:ribosomal protein S18 acetylase RimI-like enzyme